MMLDTAPVRSARRLPPVRGGRGAATVIADEALPEVARGRWCLFRTGPLDRSASVPFVAVLGPDGQELGNRWYLGSLPRLAGRGCWTVGYVAQEAVRYRLAALGRVAAGTRSPLVIRPIGAALAAMLLLAGRPSALVRLLGRENAQRVFAELATTRNRPEGYGPWIRCFEPETADATRALDAGPSLGALVFQPSGSGPEPLAATLRSLDPAMARRVVADDAPWPGAVADLEGEYVAVLQAGEVLAPHAAALARAELERLGRPAVAIADCDELSAAGERCRPEFRPEPNRALMLSGTLARGLWLVRRDALLAHRAETIAPGWAELLRLDLWLRRYEAGDPGSRRIPHVLNHRRPDTAVAPPEHVAGIVDAHLRRTGMPLRAEPRFPVRLGLRAGARAERIGLIVPSTLRDPHATECILALLDGTGYRNFELLVAVAQAEPLDEAQREAARRIAADPRARVVHLPAAGPFNFAAVNNRAAALLPPGEQVGLVNDDVTPLGADWLDHMAAHLTDPRVGIVGARLEYPDGSLQHGGVVMGIGGLCGHAHRYLPPDEVGYAGRGALTQEFSAVTAACMVVRRTVFERLGGFDEAYPSAYNDVDLCLRAREAGFATVYAAEARLTHHESRTYGSHYAGERAAFEAEEMARMGRRWAAVIAADPFHSPNLELQPEREWCLAFPPRWAPDAPWHDLPQQRR